MLSSIFETFCPASGNFETLGSKFRHETKGLLPSFATIDKVMYDKKTSHKCSSHLQDVFTISYYCCYCLRNKSKFAIHLLSQRFEHEYDPVQLNEAV